MSVVVVVVFLVFLVPHVFNFFFFFFCRCRICSENLAGLDGQEQKFRRDGAQSMGGGAMGGGAMGGLGGGVAPDSSRPLARPRNPMNKRQYGYFHFFKYFVCFQSCFCFLFFVFCFLFLFSSHIVTLVYS